MWKPWGAIFLSFFLGGKGRLSSLKILRDKENKQNLKNCSNA